MLATVSVTRASGGHGRFTENLAVRLAPLDPVEIVEVEGYRVTGLERTAVDLARILSLRTGRLRSRRGAAPESGR